MVPNDDKRMPILHKGRKKFSTEEAVMSIFNANANGKVCSTQPYCCQQNCSFVVDVSNLEEANDIKCDDLGTWKNVGVQTVYVSVQFNDDETVESVILLSKGKPKVMSSTVYKVKKSYWRHLQSTDFSRRIFEIQDFKGKNYIHCLLQYQFDGEEHMVADSPHGNSKNNSLLYMRTKSGLHKKIKKEAFSHGPNEVFDLLSGDVRLVKSSGSVPRNHQQISNARKQLCQNKEKDTLFSVMEKCKRDQSKSVPFIRRLCAFYAMTVSLKMLNDFAAMKDSSAF
jgi:hypothetical protein